MSEKSICKPRCKLVGKNGNIFNLMGLASKALRKAGQAVQAKEMSEKIMSSAKSYGEALNILAEYVSIS